MAFDRERWSHAPHAPLWALVALSVDVEPSTKFVNFHLGKFKGLDAPVLADLNERLRVAMALSDDLQKVQLHEPKRHPGLANDLLAHYTTRSFVELAGKNSWSLPDAFPATALNGATLHTRRFASHDTELLRHLEAAAKQWWSTYDPDDPSTAPTNEEVSSWLIGRNVSEHIAKAMATILRPDRLRLGPRKR
jgi:hypothetical protein